MLAHIIPLHYFVCQAIAAAMPVLAKVTGEAVLQMRTTMRKLQRCLLHIFFFCFFALLLPTFDLHCLCGRRKWKHTERTRLNSLFRWLIRRPLNLHTHCPFS